MNLLDKHSSIAILAACIGLTACANTPQFYHKSWTEYSICNDRCSILIPPILEKRQENDHYTQIHGEWNPNITVFQQKGLSEQEPGIANRHYCRVIIQELVGDANEFPSSKEQIPFDSDLLTALHAIVDNERQGWDLLSEPTYDWINIGKGNKAIEINYWREGNYYDTTHGTIYLLFNNDIMVKMVVVYRESDKDLWLPAVKHIIYTFKWNKKANISSTGCNNQTITNYLNRMDSEIVGGLIGWLIMCALFALVGKKRSIGYGWTFVLCLCLSPLVGLIIALCTKKKDTDFTEINNSGTTNQ